MSRNREMAGGILDDIKPLKFGLEMMCAAGGGAALDEKLPEVPCLK